MAGIEIVGLSKAFTVDGKPLPVLKGVNLSLREGEITVVLGKSGCGKTTLLRLVAGLETPDGGEIRMPEGERTGFVFQEPRLMPWLNVQDNVRFALGRGSKDAADIPLILETVGLAGFERAYPHQLSGGMQQRVALARALAWRPSFIMMDEPFAALDHFTREDMQRELLSVRRRMGASILFVTHSIDEALALGDSVVLLGGGVVAARFPVPQAHPRSLLTDDMIALRRQIVSALETTV